MATPEEIKRQRELNELLKEEARIRAEREGRTASDAYTRDSVQQAGAQLDYARQLTEEVKDQLGMNRAKSEVDRTTLSLARQLQTSAQQVTAEIGNEAAVAKQLNNDYKLQRDIQVETALALADLNAEQAASAGKVVALSKEIAKAKAEEASSSNLINMITQAAVRDNRQLYDWEVDKIAKLEEQKRLTEQRLVKLDQERDIAQQGIDLAQQRVITLQQQEELATEIVAQRQAELRLQNEITQAMGITGAVVTGIGGIMQRLGLRSGIFNQTVEMSAEAMRDFASEAKKGGKEVSKTRTAIEGIKVLIRGKDGIGGLGRALADPAAITAAILDGFLKVDKAATQLQQSTGQNSTIQAGLNNRLASSVDILEVMTELTAQTGMNAQNIFTPDVIAGAAELKNTLGLAADEAGGLAMIAQTTGGDIDATTDAIVDQTSAFNAANRSAVNQKQVLVDVAKASDGIKASFAGQPKLLAKSAAAARRLGMDLARLDQIAASFLDFETSIEAELEAQLLTGKAINMAKARELAMNNELGKLGDELYKNSSDILEFGKMNRIQQEAQAKALGMTRDELGRVAYQKAVELGMTQDQAAAAAGVRAEDMKRMDVQAKLAKAADKLAQAFSPMLDILLPIVDLIAGILKPIGFAIGLVMSLGQALSDYVQVPLDAIGNFFKPFTDAIDSASGGVLSLSDGFRSIGGIIASLPKLIAGIGLLSLGNAFKNLLLGKGFKFNLFSSIKDKLTGVTDKVKNVGDTAKDVLSKSKDVTGGAVDKAKDIASDAKTKTPEMPKADKTQDVLSKTEEPKSSGEKIKEFLTNLAAGLKEMASMKVLGGALNMIPASLGLVAMIPGVVGAKLLEKVNGESLKDSLVNLAAGLKEMSGGKTLLGAFNLIPASLGLVAMIPGYVGAKLLQGLDGESIKESLTGLANGISAMGSGKVLLGAVALPLASVGLLLLTPAIPTMYLLSGAGTAASTGLTALAGGLNAMAGTFIGSLALGAAALGFTLMTAGAVGLGAVALLGTAAAAGLTSLAAGLTSLGMAAPYAAVGAGILALLGVAMIPLTYAISLLAPALESLATIVEKALGGLAGIITAAANGISQILGVITPASVLSLAALGPALLSAGAGLTAFSIASLVAAPGLGVLGAIAAMSSPLATVGTSLTAVASGIAAIAAALNSLETEKLEELKDLVITTAFAAPMVAATGAITDLISGLGGGAGEGDSNKALIEEIKLLRAAVEQDRVTKVYMDSNELDMRIVQGRSGQ